jgi:hypothetical protein
MAGMPDEPKAPSVPKTLKEKATGRRLVVVLEQASLETVKTKKVSGRDGGRKERRFSAPWKACVAPPRICRGLSYSTVMIIYPTTGDWDGTRPIAGPTFATRSF